MGKNIGAKIRQVRELKGYSQEYMAECLVISQRTYSKYERGEIKLDIVRLQEISTILNVCYLSLLRFDDKLFFDSMLQFNTDKGTLALPEKLIEQYEKRIKGLEDEVAFLRDQLRNKK